MSATKEVTIWCDDDDCDRCDSFSGAAGLVGRTRRMLRERGWRFVEGRDFCPDHAATSSPERAG